MPVFLSNHQPTAGLWLRRQRACTSAHSKPGTKVQRLQPRCCRRVLRTGRTCTLRRQICWLQFFLNIFAFCCLRKLYKTLTLNFGPLYKLILLHLLLLSLPNFIALSSFFYGLMGFCDMFHENLPDVTGTWYGKMLSRTVNLVWWTSDTVANLMVLLATCQCDYSRLVMWQWVWWTTNHFK